MKINKAYKFRLYPNKDQKEFLAKSFGCVRFVYNYFLDKRKQYYEENKKGLSFVKTEEMLKELKNQEGFEWLKESNSQSLQYALRNLDNAYKRFFRKEGDYPAYHTKQGRNSVTIPQHFRIVEKRTEKFGFLAIPKLETELKFRRHRELEGKLLSATISRLPTGKYYVSFSTEQEIEVTQIDMNDTVRILGLDLNVKNLLIDSNGRVVETLKFLEECLRKIKTLQRQLKRKVKGSKNYYKAKLKLVELYEHMKNKRNDSLHKISKDNVENQDIIFAESLGIKDMVMRSAMSGKILGQCWGELIRQHKYKSEWEGKIFYQINRYYASSKTCHKCGEKNENLMLADREWRCEHCGAMLDRDYNAALNIKIEGMRMLGIVENTAGIAGIYACGDKRLQGERNRFQCLS